MRYDATLDTRQHCWHQPRCLKSEKIIFLKDTGAEVRFKSVKLCCDRSFLLLAHLADAILMTHQPRDHIQDISIGPEPNYCLPLSLTN